MLVRYKCAYAKKNCKIDLGVCLSLIQVGLFLYPSKNEGWLLDVCLSLLQVEVDFFVDERSVCFIIQVELIFGLKICF